MQVQATVAPLPCIEWTVLDLLQAGRKGAFVRRTALSRWGLHAVKQDRNSPILQVGTWTADPCTNVPAANTNAIIALLQGFVRFLLSISQ